jgi:predicted nucleotidyltransferase
MENLGEIIKKTRNEKKLPLRTVAAFLDIDQAILSKIERGQRTATRKQVVNLAAYYKLNENDLLVAWLSDKLVNELANEEVGQRALLAAEQKITYQTNYKSMKTNVLSLINKVLKKDGRVAAAWLFGSMARGEEKLNSDMDIMVEMNSKKQYSMFDLMDIAFLIEQSINRKVDLVEKGYLKDFAAETANNDFIKIYG